jgi:hypothetical protein
VYAWYFREAPSAPKITGLIRHRGSSLNALTRTNSEDFRHGTATALRTGGGDGKLVRSSILLEPIAQKHKSPPKRALHIGRTGETQCVATPSFSRNRLPVKRRFLPTGEVCALTGEGLCRTRAERTALRLVLPRHLRPRREKIFGSAPSHPLDRNAKARVWAAANAYNMANRRQHWGPLTRTTMDVLKALLWRFHGADGGGRCFPSFERIAAAAKCHRDTVCEAIKALEDAGILTWVHRIARIRRQERDLFGRLVSVWQVIRTSNAYQLLDPLEHDPGRWVWCKSENPARPQNRDLTTKGARLDGARVIQEVAPRREPGRAAGAQLSPAERAALVARLDTKPTSEDWQLWRRDLDARIDTLQPLRCTD